MATRAVPIFEDLGLEADNQVVHLSHALKEITRCPKMIALVYADARTNLELPLGWHDFSVCAGDFDASVKAAFVVLISHHSSKTLVASHRAVVWTLCPWEGILGPIVRSVKKSTLSVEKCVLLLDAVPWFFSRSRVENLLCKIPKICISWHQLCEF